MFSGDNGARDSVPHFAIVITDGNSNINPETTVPEAVQVGELLYYHNHSLHFNWGERIVQYNYSVNFQTIDMKQTTF